MTDVGTDFFHVLRIPVVKKQYFFLRDAEFFSQKEIFFLEEFFVGAMADISLLLPSVVATSSFPFFSFFSRLSSFGMSTGGAGDRVLVPTLPKLTFSPRYLQ